MKPLVSILIPAYNAEDWIAETLQSALQQTWDNTEIIVVDDGSSDRTYAIAKTFASPQLQVITQPNQGAAAARNRALQVAQGDFIQFLDADDLLAPDKLAIQLNHLSWDNPQQIASGEWARFYQSPQAATFTPEPLWANYDPIAWLVLAWEGHWMMHPAAWLIPRAISDQAGNWDASLSLNDDGEYFCRVVLASAGVQFCPGARSFYRSGLPDSLSDTKSDQAWQSLYQTLMSNQVHLLAVENTPRTRHACATALQRFIYEVYPAVPHLCQLAAQQVIELGGTQLRPTGGPLFNLLAQAVGWRWAKRMQQQIYQTGYRRWALGWRLNRRLQTLGSS
jgi:glycosyltransferase involved in cell wall biosynthesis